LLKGTLGLLLYTIAIVFLRSPVEHRLVPYLIRQFGHEQSLYIYAKAGAEPVDKYDLLIPRSIIASGRMIQVQEVAESEGRKTPRNFFVTGERSGNLLSFNYKSSTDAVGLGAFVGTRLDQDEDIYLGTLTGLGKKDGVCTIMTYWAVLGPKEKSGTFASKLEGRGDPPAVQSANKPVDCSNRPPPENGR
jgi:hypothetical protein